MAGRKNSAGAGLVVLLGVFFFWSLTQPEAQSTAKDGDDVRFTGFIAAKPPPSWGSIVGTKESAVNLTAGEIVYVRVAAGKEVREGDRFTIVHPGQKIVHPITHRKLGTACVISGELVILEGKGGLYTARLSKSVRTILVGDEIILRGAEKEMNAAHSPADFVRGFVVAPLEDEQSITAKELIFIDRGSEDGVLPGDHFVITKGGLEGEPVKKASPSVVGEAIVVSVQRDSSTALVTRSYEAIHAGDRVVSQRK